LDIDVGKTTAMGDFFLLFNGEIKHIKIMEKLHSIDGFFKKNSQNFCNKKKVVSIFF
jgi:hypothetical protein